MKRLIFALGVLFVFACSKTDKGTPPVAVIQEESIKFTTNLDTGTNNVVDTLPLVISISSKLPSAGITYSITATWTDSSKQIYKLDSSLNQASLSIQIPGFNKSGNYSLAIIVTSKSTSSNTSNKSITVVNNPLARFTGYKVDQAALAISRQKDFGIEYWKNTPVQPDIVIATFQKPYGTHTTYGTFFNAVACGDFNNDGYIDVFNGGALGNGIQALPTFLIWNPTSLKFEEKNLFNDASVDFHGPTKVVPVYLNDDNYVDLVLFCYIDESAYNPPLNKVQILLSDGKGKYTAREITTEEPTPYYKNGGWVGDLNMDGRPDIVACGGSLMTITYGTSTYPYFDETKHAYFYNGPKVSFNGPLVMLYNNDNGFGEDAELCMDRYVTTAYIGDVNKDGVNDLLLMCPEDTSSNQSNFNKVLINQGAGRFNNKSIIKLPQRAHRSENYDYIIDDVNGDGLNDIITTNTIWGNIDWQIEVYLQNPDGSFSVGNNIIITSPDRPKYMDTKWRLIYYDYNHDGKKDIGYVDGADNGQLKYKTVFIRTGNQFIEQDYFQYDIYANSIKSKIN